MATIINGVECKKLYVRKNKTKEDVELKFEGKSEQLTTNGYQLFDASKLPTTSKGGATVTNNGDGSFTISGSGNLTSLFSLKYEYSHEETVKLLKKGILYCNFTSVSMPYVEIQLVVDGVTAKTMTNKVRTSNSFEITQDILDNESSYLQLLIYGSGTITPTTIKPMLYQDGDGTWEPFTGGKAVPNPENPQEIMNVVIDEIVEVGKNLLPFSENCTNGTLTDKRDFFLFYVQGKKVADSTWKTIAMYEIKEKDVRYSYPITIDEEFKDFQIKHNGISNDIVWSCTEPFAPPKGKYTLSLYVSACDPTVANGILFSEVQFEEGAEATLYEPYRKKTVKLSEPIELNGLEDAPDVLTPDNVTRNIVEVVFDGNEEWKLCGSTSIRTDYSYPKIKLKDTGSSLFYAMMCTHAQNNNYIRTYDPTKPTSIEIKNVVEMFGLSEYSVAAWKAYLAEQYAKGTPVTLQYVTTEPIIEELPTADKNALIDLQAFMNGYELYEKLYINDVLVFSTEMFVFKDGTLADGITLSKLSNTNNTLYAGVEDETDDGEDYSTNLTAYISNIDCTDYQYIDITLEHMASVNYGSAYIQYGIGSANITLNDDEGTKNETVTLDVSSLSGVQSICFYLYAKNKSTAAGWGASAWIKISEIKLHN